MYGTERGTERSQHARLLDAGWSYRTNTERGWVIYRDPATQLWHPRAEAILILQASALGTFSQPNASIGDGTFGDAPFV